MPNDRPRMRRTGALTRRSVRRENRPRPQPPAAGRDRLTYLRSPATWLAGILLAVATVTFQDVLTGTVKATLPIDGLPDRLSPQDAVTVVEVRNVKEYGDYLVRGDKDGRLTEALDSGASWRDETDAVDVGRAEWMVTLQGHATQQVRITDIVPELVGGKCSSPPTGSLVHSPSQGSTEVIPLEVTIDAPVPELKVYKDGESKDGNPYFTGADAKHITLKQDESEAFYIAAKSQRGHCRWKYRIHYQVGGSKAEQVLSRPGGKPFELTGKLKDVSRYKAVHFPSFICPRIAAEKHGWLKGSGEKYARALHEGDEVPCPGK